MMKTERLLLRYSDGTSEWQTPATVPDLGSTIRRAGQQWVVASIETESDVIVAVLRRAPKAAELSDVQVEVA
jgi:hypothetical protein